MCMHTYGRIRRMHSSVRVGVGVLGVAPEPPGAAALVARRHAFNSDLAALPVAAEWPNLKTL
jgi:hypothetical protein